MELETQEYEQNDYDNQILNLLNSCSKPLSSFAISILTGIRHDRVCKKLEKLRKYGFVVCCTSREVKFWRSKEL